jgi:hypothetical protein
VCLILLIGFSSRSTVNLQSTDLVASSEKQEPESGKTDSPVDIGRLEDILERLVQDTKSQAKLQNLLDSLKPLTSKQIGTKLVNKVYLDFIKLIRSGYSNDGQQKFIQKILTSEKLNSKIK